MISGNWTERERRSGRKSKKTAVEIYGKGGTILPTGTETFELNKPAVVKMKRKKFKPFRLVYRLSLPREEMEIAVKNPEYFRHFMDETLRVAMSNYTATIGTFDKVRFGEVYCTPFRPGPENQVFTELDDHNIELRLYSNFASEEEVK